MAVNSTLATSRRGYLSQSELEQFANITIVDATEADDRISQAEEIVDAYVGYQDRFMAHPVAGLVSAVSGNTFTLEDSQKTQYDNDYFKLCEVEIIGGAGEGQRRKIISSTKEGVITVASAWNTSIDTTSFYRIYQLGKFPRLEDVEAYTNTTTGTNKYYKQIPEEVKRAVAGQVEYVIEMGDEYFAGDKADLTSESIGDYSYTKTGGSSMSKMVSPKVKSLLRTIINRTGRLV